MFLRKSQEGLIIAGFALATVMIIALLVTYLSNRVVDMIAIQNQVFFSKQAYWNAYSGMELTTSEKIVSLEGIPDTEVSFATGTITITGTTTANAYLGGNKVATIASTGSDAGGRSRAMKLTIGIPKPLSYALVFDGDDDFVSHSMDLVTSTSASISAWFMKKGGDGSKQHLVMLDDAENPGYGTHLLVDTDNKLFFSIQDYSERQNPSIKSSSTYTANSLWYHVVTTWNKSSLNSSDFNIYVNGIDVTDLASFSAGGYDTDFAFNIDEGTIGADSRTGVPAEFFNGLIDEVAIWNIALSEAQIRSLYIQSRAFLATNILNGNLVGYWNFNDKADPPVNTTGDVSTNSNTGNIDGATFTGT